MKEDKTTPSILMHQSEVMRYIGVSESKFRQIKELEGFPKAVRPGMKRNMYFREEIEKWVKELTRVTE